MLNVGTGSRVLIVDDEPSILAALELILEELGFHIETVATKKAALALLEESRFDLAILDKNLPDGNGLEIARAIRESGHDTKCIILTGYANLSSAVEALKLGLADYISKPFDMDDLTARLARILGVLKLERDNISLTAELQQKNAILEKLATRDPLTHLSNHAHFQECLKREVLRAKRGHTDVSLLLFDLDNFKVVNDSHGHPMGDKVLKMVASVLTTGGRRSDQQFRLREQDIAARYGGDEFALLLPDTPKTGAAVLAERLRDALASTMGTGADVPSITVSVGLASFPADATDRADLVRCADVSLYAAKRSGRNRTFTYSPGLEKVAGLTTSLAADKELVQLVALDESIEQENFRFVYQPIADIEKWGVFAYEALMRPLHPDLDGPLDVVGAAERTGRVHLLGRVLRKLASSVLPNMPGDSLLFLNLNPLDIHDEELLALEPFFKGLTQRVVLEITETTAIRDYDRARERVKTLQDLGFRVAIDDFGAGYSGLNSLARLEPDFAKLDMGLVRGISGDTRLGRLVEHLLEFCAGEGMMVVAEGVETREELDAVRSLRCPLVQGYYLAKPGDPFVGIRPRDD